MSIETRQRAQLGRLVDLMLLQPSGVDLTCALAGYLPPEIVAAFLAAACVRDPDGWVASQVAATLERAMATACMAREPREPAHA